MTLNKLFAGNSQRNTTRWLMLILLLGSLVMVFPAAAQEASEEGHTVGVELVADGLASPVAIAYPNDDSGRMFIVDQVGTIWIVTAEGEVLPDPFLDMSGQITPLEAQYDERGVLGLAFHPDYANNGRLFVYYTIPLRDGAPEGWDHTNVVGELNVSADDANVADLASLKEVLLIDQPQGNHNAGHIAFGPDGYLYIPIGDGGGGNDTDEGHTPDLGNGQDLSNVHGSILRIDVNGTPGEYTVPEDNPFVGQDGVAPEIYAYGLRNPYHISFDRGGEGALFAADAGQELYEEIDIITAGGNYGWNIKEGTHCFDAANPETAPAECATTGANGDELIDPIVEYTHEDIGVVVVGGYVYRGTALPDFDSYYIFGDYTSSFEAPDGTLMWAEAAGEGEPWTWGELAIAGMDSGRLDAYVLGMGEGPDGELYVLTTQTVGPSGDTGSVWRLVPAGDDAGGSDDASATEEAESTDSTDGGEAAATEEAAGGEGDVPEPVTTPES